ncbi:MAG: hypothetical protein ACI9JY_002482, partial [Saprospiraceae bacterium]
RPWQGRALPTELFSHFHFLKEQQYLCRIADANLRHLLNYTSLFYKKIQDKS